MDSAREDLPRVSVDTVRDWQRFKSNYTQAALARAERQILADNLSDQRDVLHSHINQFVSRTFAKAQPNIRVNGRNFESLDENEQDMEAFDEALDRLIWSLADNRLRWHSKIAETRRTQPTEIEEKLRILLNQQWDVGAETPSPRIDAKDDHDLAVDALSQRDAQIQELFQKISALGEELKQTLPVQRERSERIVNMTAEIKALKP